MFFLGLSARHSIAIEWALKQNGLYFSDRKPWKDSKLAEIDSVRLLALRPGILAKLESGIWSFQDRPFEDLTIGELVSAHWFTYENLREDMGFSPQEVSILQHSLIRAGYSLKTKAQAAYADQRLAQ